MNRIASKPGSSSGSVSAVGSDLMGSLVNALARLASSRRTSIITCFVPQW
jgi:hypothetical protein